MEGTCALCRKTADLLDSHYMPKSVYRAVTRGYAPQDNAPVLVNVPEKSAFRSNRQFRQHLLCASCESLLNRNGENVVLPQIARDESEFFLLDAMKAGEPSDVKKGKAIYNGPSAPRSIDAVAYQYFAVSMFWRGAVTRWQEPASQYFGALGPNYSEVLRRYLLGETDFPKDARLLVFVDYEDRTRSLSYFPVCKKDKMLECRVWRHSFLVPGVRFILVVGRGLAFVPDVGATPVHRIAFFEWHPRATDFEKDLLVHMSGVKAKGSLAKK